MDDFNVGKPFSFDEYQKFVESTMRYPTQTHSLIYPALKLNGEAGEVAEKIGKLWRNQGITEGKDVNEKDRFAIVKELGDCLWYITALAKELGTDISQVATINVAKLQDRMKRSVICSEGDNR